MTPHDHEHHAVESPEPADTGPGKPSGVVNRKKTLPAASRTRPSDPSLAELEARIGFPKSAYHADKLVMRHLAAEQVEALRGQRTPTSYRFRLGSEERKLVRELIREIKDSRDTRPPAGTVTPTTGTWTLKTPPPPFTPERYALAAEVHALGAKLMQAPVPVPREKAAELAKELCAHLLDNADRVARLRERIVASVALDKDETLTAFDVAFEPHDFCALPAVHGNAPEELGKLIRTSGACLAATLYLLATAPARAATEATTPAASEVVRSSETS